MTPLGASLTNPCEGGASFPLKHRLLRLAWGIVWGELGRWTPAPLHGWRRALLRLFGAWLAATAKVYPGARVWYPPNLKMAEYACLGARANSYCTGPISIDPYELMSQGAHPVVDDVPILTGTRHGHLHSVVEDLARAPADRFEGSCGR